MKRTADRSGKDLGLEIVNTIDLYDLFNKQNAVLVDVVKTSQKRRDIGGPGFRAMSMHTENSNLTYSDDEGAMELTMKDGTKTLVAKGPGGEVLFSGPVTTPDERKAMPDAVRARLEKLEGMHNLTFRTDGDFRGAESKTLRPRGIAFPPQERAPMPPARTFF